MTQNIGKYMKPAAKLTSFLLKNIPLDCKDNVKSDMQVLTELAGSILSDIKETELGKMVLIRFIRHTFSLLRSTVLTGSLCSHWKLLRPRE